MEPVLGGRRRQDSVRLGLESLKDLAPDTVLIHDAARPILDSALIDRVLDALQDGDGAIPALAIADTLKLGAAEMITGEVPREGIFRAQTPQGFRFEAILDAHQRTDRDSKEDFTDDAAIAAFAGIDVALVAGSEGNFKITTDDDLARARALMSYTEVRSGQGYDVHAFAEPGSGPLRLCGIDIPFAHGLCGHSDADAGLHALADALLGTIAAGDIGQHFPPTEARWKDANSETFIRHALDLVRQAGGRVINVDLTIICEAPKIAPYGNAIRDRLANILELEKTRVSIKATTTEKLGALGHGDGIAAQAIATAAFEG